MRFREPSTLAAVLVPLVLLVLLAGCDGGGDGDSDDEARIGALEAAVDAARAGVVRDVVDAVDAEFGGGTRRFGWCGESYAPRGVLLDEHLRFEPSPLGVADAADTVARVLEEQGWAVERPANPAIVIGRLDEVEVRAELGPAALQVDIGNHDCLETGDAAARAFADRPAQEVVWEGESPPSPP